MIFVTVGSRKYPFDRLFKKLDELYEKEEFDEEIFAQIGTSVYLPKYYHYQRFLPAEEFEARIRDADIVISHGASGSIMKALNSQKKVVAVTRLQKYGEHINDHQIQCNSAFSDEKYVLMADPELTDLKECIERIHKGTDGLRLWKNPNSKAIINMLDKFIQENWNDGR